MRYQIEHSENDPATSFETEEECLSFLHSLASNAVRPIGVFLYRSEGESLSCVLGASATFYVYYPANYEGKGAWNSLAQLVADHPLDYWLCGHHTQAAEEHQVPSHTIEPVVLEFLQTGKRSEAVQWVSG